MIQFGIDRLVADAALRAPLAGRRVGLLAHPASVTATLEHSLDALARLPGLTLSAAFGPQHGLRGDKQDNMVESPDFVDPAHGIPVFSLYGEVRRPTDAMMDTFDVLLVDLQDLGCRIYTFITTLRYVLEAAARHRKSVWVLDRPNPAGRPVEGLLLRPGWESFVGAGPMPMRHGLTMAELARWFVRELGLDVDLQTRADGRMAAGGGAGLRLAAAAAQLGEPEPERAEPVDGARLRGHRDARGHHALGGARHDAAAGAVRRAGPRRDARWRARCAAWRRSGSRAACCASAGSSRPSTSTSASCAPACRSTSTTRPTGTTSSGRGG